MPAMHLDAHQHFWRYDSEQYPWIPKDSPLHGDHLPPELAELQKPLGLDGSIVVQARQIVAESDWLLGLADADPRIKAVVGWVDLRSPKVVEDLARLSRHPRFAGVRHVAQDEPDDRFLVGADFVPAAIELVGKFPEQPFVMDHIAKPKIKEGTLSPWRENIRELARAPHVLCKVSGMVTEADQKNWKPADLRPYLDVVFEAFGPERLMWGSDWPVCLLAASYERVYRVIEEYASALTAAQREAVFGGNCARFYLG
jgi:L-fuconolactonase